MRQNNIYRIASTRLQEGSQSYIRMITTGTLLESLVFHGFQVIIKIEQK